MYNIHAYMLHFGATLMYSMFCMAEHQFTPPARLKGLEALMVNARAFEMLEMLQGAHED